MIIWKPDAVGDYPEHTEDVLTLVLRGGARTGEGAKSSYINPCLLTSSVGNRLGNDSYFLGSVL